MSLLFRLGTDRVEGVGVLVLFTCELFTGG